MNTQTVYLPCKMTQQTRSTAADNPAMMLYSVVNILNYVIAWNHCCWMMMIPEQATIKYPTSYGKISFTTFLQASMIICIRLYSWLFEYNDWFYLLWYI